MDDLQRDALDAIDEILARLSRLSAIDIEAAQAATAWETVARRIRGKTLQRDELVFVARRAQRAAGMAVAA